MWVVLRWTIVTVLAIGLPIAIYLTFFADEPVFGAEQDVDLGMQTVRAIAEDPEQYPLLAKDEYPEAYADVQRIVDRKSVV